MSKVIVIIFVVIVIITLGGGFYLLPNPNNTKNPSDNNLEKVPDFELKDYSGNTVTLSDFAGRPLVINSWAAWCPFCVDELPDFAAAQKELGDKVVIIAIDRAESLKIAKEYTDELGITDDLILLIDPRDSFYKSIGGFTMPETIFVDKDGFIRDRKRGPMELEEILEKIEPWI